ncbi:lysophospholipid acyltransferase family protein [Falsigemmobacter intermedius]|uniref:lysophospholipid acyltransferase family protein n=1 Tax=Falsigemmobacter intermedius TaxID=1553448 RepID=UPI003EFE6BA6
MSDQFLAQAARLATVFSCRALLSLRSADFPEHNGRPRIYAANHVSHADFVALWTALPRSLRSRTRPVAGADYWEASGFRRWLIHRVFRGVLVERGGKREPGGDNGEVIRQLAAPLKAGEDLIFFPEGTRNLTGTDLMRLRSGIYLLLQEVPDAEVVPVWISHMDRILPKGGYVPVPLNCELRYGPPLRPEPGEERLEFLARLHAAILACRRSPV